METVSGLYFSRIEIVNAGMYFLTNLSLSNADTVRFNKCLSFAVEDENIAQSSELIYYANSDLIVGQRSYVLFDIAACEPGNCVFDEGDMSKVHMVALDDFVESFIEYFPNKREAYCEQCLNHQSYCTSSNGMFFDQATFSNGGSFCYEGDQYEMINCGQCTKMGCYGGSNSQKYEDWDEVGEWVMKMAQCQQTGTYWKNYPMYTGLTCNSAGDGVEFGVFLDEDCTLYHKQKAFKNFIDDDDWQMLYKMPSVIEYMFTSSISCKDDSKIKYMNAFQPVYTDNNGQANYNDNYYQQAQEEFAYEVAAEGNSCQLGQDINDSCQGLFQDNEMAYSLGDCLYNIPEWSGEGGEGNYDGDSDIDALWNLNDLYSYEISAADVGDMGRVCHIIANKYAYFASGGTFKAMVSSYANTASSGYHQNVFNEEGSGSMFDYNNAKNNYYAKAQHDSVVNSFEFKQEETLSVGEKFVIYTLGLLVAGLSVLALMRVYKARTQIDDVVFVDKDVPLMS